MMNNKKANGGIVMNIALLDDEQGIQRKIENLLHNAYDDVEINAFHSPEELLNSKEAFDLLLLDVEMPQLDGVTFSHQYQSKYPAIIFVSDHSEYVYDCFYPNIYGFVKKQELDHSLIGTVNKVRNKKSTKIIIPTQNGIMQINQENIIYFYIESNCYYAVTTKGKIYLTIDSMKELSIDHTFYKVNRQYLVNLTHVLHIYRTTHEITMSNQNKIFISRRNWSEFLNSYIAVMDA